MPRSISLKSWRKKKELFDRKEMENWFWKSKVRNLSVKGLPSEYEDGHLSVYLSSSVNTSVDKIPMVPYSRFVIERDYTVQYTAFFDDMPSQLTEMLIDPHVWERTIKEINKIMQKATRTSLRTVYETVTSYVTCYLVNIFRETYYEKCLDRLRYYILYQNMTEYMKKGLKLSDPSLNGFRYLEFVVLDHELLKAQYEENMIGKKLDKEGNIIRKRQQKTDPNTVFEDPQPGTTASFGIPTINVPVDEVPVGPEACHGIHEMHFLVPELNESSAVTGSSLTPSLNGEESGNSTAGSSSWYSTSSSLQRHGRSRASSSSRDGRKSGTGSSASSWYTPSQSLSTSIESLDLSAARMSQSKRMKPKLPKSEGLFLYDSTYFEDME